MSLASTNMANHKISDTALKYNSCFSLDQDLSVSHLVLRAITPADQALNQLWDHIQLSGTCKAFRNAYDDLAWKSLYEKHVLVSSHSPVSSTGAAPTLTVSPTHRPRELKSSTVTACMRNQAQVTLSLRLVGGRSSSSERLQLMHPKPSTKLHARSSSIHLLHSTDRNTTAELQ